eukprot:COSAG06_NODE_774_length_12424_cov_35.268014_19_plen_54_part_00
MVLLETEHEHVRIYCGSGCPKSGRMLRALRALKAPKNGGISSNYWPMSKSGRG